MRKLILLTFLIFVFGVLQAKTPQTSQVHTHYKVMFYNVENYFDTKDDPDKNDNDFLPEGKKHWTYNKMEEKRNSIAKVITAVGEGTPVAIVGMCEVENDYVLTSLVKYSPLKNYGYKFIHYESADKRGIDTALLYDPEQFIPISSKPLRKEFKDGKLTRDVLYVSGKTSFGDTLHVFVCHAPSRIGGKNKSEHYRVAVMSMVREHTDSIMSINPNANIIIMGDFNDSPIDKSISIALGAKPLAEPYETKSLYNMFHQFMSNPFFGTHKYQSEWSILDQIIVSGNLLNSGRLHQENAYIFRAEFLLEEDKKNMSVRPKRTYNGLKYQGGYSDHLPVVVEFFLYTTKFN